MQTSACTQKAARFGETTCRPSFPPPFASPRQEASPGNLLSLGLVPRHGSGFSQKQRAGTPGSQPTKRRRTAAHRGLRASPPGDAYNPAVPGRSPCVPPSSSSPLSRSSRRQEAARPCCSRPSLRRTRQRFSGAAMAAVRPAARRDGPRGALGRGVRRVPAGARRGSAPR